MKKKNGFTLIELLAVIVILAIILLIAVPIVLNVIEDTRKGAFKNSAGYLMKAAENKYLSNQLQGKEEDLVYVYENGQIKSGQDLDYKGETPKNGTIVVRKDGKIGIAIDNGNWCAIKEYNEDTIKLVKLTEGMTPIKWNGTEEVTTTKDDPDWYDYTNKKWANVKTADGSYWVWIPRYAYKITSGYHTNKAGTIDVKFLKNKTNETTEGITIETSGYEVGVKDTSMHYFLHPVFTFGEEEIIGFWVAKFEASGSPENINVVPGVQPSINLKINDQFMASYNMRNNSKYGWITEKVDTHMAKNIEWGAVVYLSKSIFGANEEIWINNREGHITGCAGTSVSASRTTVCQEYNTSNGVKASTTHNITGVYDMSGGAYEYVAAYVDNANGNLVTYGNDLITADNKYKDVYFKGATDTVENNYNANMNKYGDSMYETSKYGHSANSSWYTDYSYIPYSSEPFFHRGGGFHTLANSGIFAFARFDGKFNGSTSFRVVVIVQ